MKFSYTNLCAGQSDNVIKVCNNLDTFLCSRFNCHTLQVNHLLSVQENTVCLVIL